MKKQLHRYLALMLLGILALPDIYAEEQVVTMETSKSTGDTLTFFVNKKSGVSVDWGDGIYVPYTTDSIVGTLKQGNKVTVKGNENWYIFSCENNELTSLNVTNATLLKTLFCNQNSLSKLDISKNVELTDLDCSNNQLTALSTTNNSELLYLNCSDNEITSLTSTFYNKKIETIICNSNKLKTLPVGITSLKSLMCGYNEISKLNTSRMTLLEILTCPSNNMTEINFGAKDSLQILLMQDNSVENIDLSQAQSLQTLNCSDNNLSKITYYSPKVKKDYYYINCSNNNLLYNSLISTSKVKNSATNYIYAPQGLYEIQQTMDVADTLNLSETRYNAEDRAIASFSVYTKDGTKLSSGVDYRIISSQKIKFYKPFVDSVYIEISASRYFPNLTIRTTNMQVTDVVSINQVQEDIAGFNVRPGDGEIYMSANKETLVRIYTSDGCLYWQGLVSAGEHTMTLPHGIYIVNSIKVKI